MDDRAARTEGTAGARVVELTGAQTHRLRALVLRDGTPSSDLVWAGDDDDTTFHLGVVIGAATEPVAISTWLRQPSPDLTSASQFDPASDPEPDPEPDPEADHASDPEPNSANGVGVQLRGMATDPTVRGIGLGSLLLRAGLDRARQDGADHLWANARTAALDFYVDHGFAVTSDEFVSTDTEIPHRRILRRLHSV